MLTKQSGVQIKTRSCKTRQWTSHWSVAAKVRRERNDICKCTSHLREMSGRFKRRAFLRWYPEALAHLEGAEEQERFHFFCLIEYYSCVHVWKLRHTHTHTPVCEYNTSMSVYVIIQHTCGWHVMLTCAGATVVSFHHMCDVLTFSGCAHVGVCVLYTFSLNCLSLWSHASPALLSVSWKPNGLFDPIRARAKSTLPSLDPARAS